MQDSVPLIKHGWLRALLFLLVWLAAQIGFGSILMLFPAIVNPPGIAPSLKLLIQGFMSLVISIPTVFVFRKYVDRKSFASLGFAWKKNQKHAWTGFFAALLILSLGCLILIATGNLSFIGLDFSLQDILISIITMTIVAISEELVVRGYILNNLLDSFSKWVALLISATLFAAFHFANPDFSWISMLGVFLGGLLLGINYIYTKNLWYGIFCHFCWNFFQGPVFGFKVSGLETSSILIQHIKGSALLTGGAFGFEASALSCLLLFIFTALLALYYFRNKTAFTA